MDIELVDCHYSNQDLNFCMIASPPYFQGQHYQHDSFEQSTLQWTPRILHFFLLLLRYNDEAKPPKNRSEMFNPKLIENGSRYGNVSKVATHSRLS